MEMYPVETSDAPAAIGPYSQAFVTDGWVFCSGQVALDAATGELIEGSIAEQTKKAMENLAAVLTKAGTHMSNVVKVTIYLTNMDDFAEVNGAYGEFVDQQPPARATVGVAALPRGARVEIDCVARIP